MRNRLIGIVMLGTLAGLVVISMNPVNSKIHQLAFLGCLAAVWVGFTVLVWKQKVVRICSLVVPLFLVIPFALPSGEIDADELREDYVKRMNEFEGTRYFWGGESSRGIDCSGLPRRALRDALLAYGVKHFNGAAFRAYAEQWWYDASAKALGQGYRDYTKPLGAAGSIKEMSYEGLVPGDLAVTDNEMHILAYAGDGMWIQAAPEVGSVATLHGRDDENLWFTIPVTMHRWALLSSGGNN